MGRYSWEQWRCAAQGQSDDPSLPESSPKFAERPFATEVDSVSPPIDGKGGFPLPAFNINIDQLLVPEKMERPADETYPTVKTQIISVSPSRPPIRTLEAAIWPQVHPDSTVVGAAVRAVDLFVRPDEGVAYIQVFTD
jgi:hypothetical protein